jgi:hypothetical protein
MKMMTERKAMIDRTHTLSKHSIGTVTIDVDARPA